MVPREEVAKRWVSGRANGASRSGRTARRFVMLLIIAALAGWPFIAPNPYLTNVGVNVWIFATFALSMNLTLRMGRLSFVHGALMGLGAYAAALVMIRLNAPFWVGFPLSGIIGALCTFLIGVVVLRTRGVYFALLTFAVGEALVLVFIQWVGLFGGTQGLFNVPGASLLGFTIPRQSDYYLPAFALALAAYMMVRWLYKNEMGRTIEALNENEDLARSLGMDVFRFRLLVFTASGFIAGLAGGLYASYNSFVTPEAFTFAIAINAIIMNVLGGAGVAIGPVLGALILVPLPQFLSGSPEYQELLYGLILIVSLLVLPDGLSGAYRRVLDRLMGDADA